MKASGKIRRLHSGFRRRHDEQGKQTLQDCATIDEYYNADDEEELEQAFRDIALKLSSLYLSK